MKKTLLLFVMLIGAASLFAQTPYCCVTKGAVLTYTNYDAKGRESGTTTNIYNDVTVISDKDYDVQIQTVVNMALGSSTAETTMEVRNGCASVSMNNGTMEITTTDPDLLRVPYEMSVGQKLPLGDMTMDMNGFKVTAHITENEVVAQEEITTPAGTYDCFVVQQTSWSRVMGIKSETTTKIWYARGIGQVKQESYSKGKLSATMVLTSVQNM